MPSIEQLKQATRDFFDKHWDTNSGIVQPEWSEPWMFFHEVPFNNHRGCYVHVTKEDVVYIGVALNSGIEGYKDHSLGARIRNYWEVDKTKEKLDGKTYYKPSTSLMERGIDTIYTLGFPLGEQEYLAIALEHYLIQRLNPRDNIIYNSR